MYCFSYAAFLLRSVSFEIEFILTFASLRSAELDSTGVDNMSVLLLLLPKLKMALAAGLLYGLGEISGLKVHSSTFSSSRLPFSSCNSCCLNSLRLKSW